MLLMWNIYPPDLFQGYSGYVCRRCGSRQVLIGNHFTAVHHFTLEGAATPFNFKLVCVRPVASTGMDLFTAMSPHPTGFRLKRH